MYIDKYNIQKKNYNFVIIFSDYKLGNTVRIKNSEYCDVLCDKPLGNET